MLHFLLPDFPWPDIASLPCLSHLSTAFRDSPVIYEFKGMICECLERIRAKIDVYDYDRFSLNDHMGRVLLHLKDVRVQEGDGGGGA